MERALLYEYLIRATFNCDQYGKKGADADIYRYMHELQNLHSETLEGRFRIGVFVGMISIYLQETFDHIISLHEDNYDFVEEIKKYKFYLSEPTVEKLDKCVDEAGIAYEEIILTYLNNQ